MGKGVTITYLKNKSKECPCATATYNFPCQGRKENTKSLGWRLKR
jgi:hypothetical protein